MTRGEKKQNSEVSAMSPSRSLTQSAFFSTQPLRLRFDLLRVSVARALFWLVVGAVDARPVTAVGRMFSLRGRRQRA